MLKYIRSQMKQRNESFKVIRAGASDDDMKEYSGKMLNDVFKPTGDPTEGSYLRLGTYNYSSWIHSTNDGLMIEVTVKYMTTAEQAYPTEFAYMSDYTTAPVGWHVAVMYMKHSGAACKIICPSKQGLDAEKNSVTPYGYDMQIQIPRY